MDAVFQQVLQEIRPTPAEIARVRAFEERISGILRETAAQRDITLEFIELEGSTGIKQTQLQHDADLDLFVGLPRASIPEADSMSRRQLKKRAKQLFKDLIEEWLEPTLEGAGVDDLVLSYAEHPYLSGKYQDLDLDVVLCFNMDKQELLEHGPVTSVDRTPWHSRFIRDVLSDDQRDEVRLLKQFCKAQHAYGDKSAPGRAGFVGYALELLVHHYGNAKTVFQDFTELPFRAHDTRNRDLRFFKNHRRFEGDVLIIMDPTDAMRNVAASISRRAYYYVARQVQKFLGNPSPAFFQKGPIPETSTLTYPGRFFVVEFHARPDYHYTIARDKLHSIGDSVCATAERLGGRDRYFPGVEYELYFKANRNQYALAFYCPTPQLEKTIVRKGPKSGDARNVQKFRAKHPGAFEHEGHWAVRVPREVTTFEEFLDREIPRRLDPHLKYLELVTSIPGTYAPISLTGRQAIVVLKEMVLPFLK